MKPVVIVGAGLAGLTCARTLKRSRVPFIIVDAEDRIGGRLKTDTVGGFRLDRGYQVYFTAYPHAKDQLDEDKLDLKPFQSSATIIWDGDQYLFGRDKPLQFAVSGLLGMGDKLRLGMWTSDVQWMDQDDIDDVPDRSIEQYLSETGFSAEGIDRLFRPFLGAIFLDRSLSTSCRQLLFVWKALTEGETAVPALGMEEIPKQIGATFGHGSLRLGKRVAEVIRRNGAVGGVTLTDGQEIEAEHVVLACDALQAETLSGSSFGLGFRHSATLYFTSTDRPVEEGWLVLNGNARGIVSHLAVMPNSPAGETLFAVTILGRRDETDGQLADIVKAELRIWFPGHDTEAWEFLRCYRAVNAQMEQPSGFRDRLPKNDSGVPGLYFAGEFTTNSSIDGAIQSGADCAQLVLESLGVGVA